MTEPYFGIIINKDDSGDPRPAVFSDLSVLGIVLPSDDADPSVFPLNVAVDINTGDQTTLQAAGTGDLYNALTAINDQLGDLQVSARAVVARVPMGQTVNETIANIVGDQAAGTGIYALLQAGQRLGVIPRLIGAPGYTGVFARASNGSTVVSSAAKTGGNTGNGALTLANPSFRTGVRIGTYKIRCIGGGKAVTAAAKQGGNTGTGTIGSLSVQSGAALGNWLVTCIQAATNGGTFAVEDPSGNNVGGAVVGSAYAGSIGFTIADGATDFVVGDQFVVNVANAVPVNGGVFSVTGPAGDVMANATVGVAYTTEVAFTIADGATDFAIGDGFDLTVVGVAGSAMANPIVAALPSVLNALLAHAVVGGPGMTKQDALDLRETINSQRIIFVDNWDIVSDGAGGSRNEDGAIRVLALGPRVDFMNEGVPSKSWANQPIQGILDVKRHDSFSVVDGATDGQELLANNIGITERGELNVETAAADSGFVFIGTDNAGSDALWRFYNQTRMRDYIHLAMLRSVKKRLGVNNITPHGVQAVENDMIAILSDLAAGDHILSSFNVGFEASKNSPSDLRAGRFRVFFAAEEPAPMRLIEIDSRRNYAALTVELQQLVIQANNLITG